VDLGGHRVRPAPFSSGPCMQKSCNGFFKLGSAFFTLPYPPLPPFYNPVALFRTPFLLGQSGGKELPLPCPCRQRCRPDSKDQTTSWFRFHFALPSITDPFVPFLPHNSLYPTPFPVPSPSLHAYSEPTLSVLICPSFTVQKLNLHTFVCAPYSLSTSFSPAT